METDTPAEQEVIVETETPVEKEVVAETTIPAEEEPIVATETDVGTEETPTTPTTTTTVAAAEEEEPPTATEAEPTVPHVHEATGEPLPVITIAYPLQNSLDCPHCLTSFPGDKLEDLRKHLQDNHSDSRRDWLYLCAFCMERIDEEEDAILHMLREHGDILRSLSPSGIFQAWDRLIAPPRPRHSPVPPPDDSHQEEEEEEEVPPLPPTIFPPLPPEEPRVTPPPPPNTPPSEKDDDVINTAQKGFLPYEGCFEHTFLLRSCLEDARRRKKKIGVAWLDLENAFGSVPTEHLLGSMEELGLTGCTLEAVRDIYTGSTTRVKIGKVQTDVVECRRGVKQGCPLSPILFDLAMEQLVSGLEGENNFGYAVVEGEKVAILAYADDLCLMAESPERLQEMLDRTKEFADWAGLKFRPNKCATLMINNRAPRHFVEKTTFHMGSGQLPSMKWEDHYRYLGCEMGRDPRAETKTAGDRYRKESEKILASQLTDWQKLDAIRRFVRPKLMKSN